MAHEAEFKTCLKGIATGGIGLEVGAHLGDATRVLVDVLKPASITLIDPWVHDEEYRHRPFACNTRDNKLKKPKVVCAMNSQTMLLYLLWRIDPNVFCQR